MARSIAKILKMKNPFMNMRRLMHTIWLWPPYLGAGISVKAINEDFTVMETQLKQRWWNLNYVGTHYGGSIYSMCDPFYMFIAVVNLGKDYIVWDKAFKMKYVKPGLGTLTARFEISKAQLAVLRQQAETGEKVVPWFTTEVLDEQGEVIAVLEKQLYIKKKDRALT